MEKNEKKLPERAGAQILKEGMKPRTLFYFSGVLVLILYHIGYDLSFGDVVSSYGNVLKRGSEYFPKDGNILEAIYNFTVFHYNQWSSRNVIEAVLIIVGRLPAVCWRILDIGMAVLMGYCLDCLVQIKDQKVKYLSIFSFLMMYPVVAMRSAGWIATTMNYSWVAATGLYVYLNIQRIRKGEQISKLSYVLALLAALYAMNQEQMCGFLLLILGMFLVKDLWDKKLKKAVLPFFVLNLAEFIWILTCPGNAFRKYGETVAYYPIYEDYSLIQKVYEGICSLLKGLFDVRGGILITLTCLLLLGYLVFKNKSSVFMKVTAVIPVIYVVVKCVNEKFQILTGLEGINGFLMDYRSSKRAAVLGCLMLACIFLTCYYVTRKLEEQMMFLGILGAASATKAVLGFSLAFLVSGERTSIFLTFTLILSALFLMEKNEDLFAFMAKKKCMLLLAVLNLGLLIWNCYSIANDRII
ncbi:MAG: hypothetical protein HFH41_09860 [Lachnospiraceae bacterium]|nr:hypothetical protein [Lachnospiraceae bacterium]